MELQRLPKLEIFWNGLVGIGSIATVCYQVYSDSRKYFSRLDFDNFIPGWNILPYQKDVSNFEWNFWFRYFWKILPWFLLYSSLGLVSQLLKIRRRRCYIMLTALSLCCLTYLLGVKIIAFYLLHCSIAFASSCTGNKIVVWGTTLSLLSTLNIEMFNANFMRHVYNASEDSEGKNYYLFVFCLALINLRYISFSLERCDSQTSKSGFIDMIIYVFYLPLFFTGPVLTYDLFLKQIIQDPPPWTFIRIKQSLFNFARVLVWVAFNEFILHFLYFGAIHQRLDVLQEISLWTLVGLAYCEGQFFMNKYLVIYELPGQLAKLEGIEAPRGPKCISYIYRYSDLWKTFDKGFYNFLKRYVYIPVGGSRNGLLRQLFGSFICFMFIFIWHGAEFYLFMWCILNYVGCTVEFFGDWFVNTSYTQKYINKISVYNRNRLKGLLSVPLYLVSSMGIFVFFNGSSVGRIFFYRLLVNITWPSFMFFLYLLYCNIQNAIQVQYFMVQRTKSKFT
ncbi:hypothetical protein LOTGIDRAFT_113414 [Lottia gigantea]|uniref:Protein-cysteine N-palmitoyltransferase Rasp n=1 Tax=Lottia gigantea TaxID=225164 RepID=V4AWV1_LOTGI|nr:hypothetical protein LOTGIDRAFT_113414 [Lottia gigantea]ESO99515.1 hypothetical protein LOTGIDRAFT_113414 [Lottia gigantea]